MLLDVTCLNKSFIHSLETIYIFMLLQYNKLSRYNNQALQELKIALQKTAYVRMRRPDSALSLNKVTFARLLTRNKTKIMIFGTQRIVKHIPTDTIFTFFGKTVQPVQNPKDLGWLNYGLKYIF